MPRTRTLSVTILALLAGLASCGVTDPDIDAEGTVRFVDLEGGCWVIEAGDVTLLPINLPESFRVDGLLVDFEAVERTDLSSICQTGIIVEITEIRRAGGLSQLRGLSSVALWRPLATSGMMPRRS